MNMISPTNEFLEIFGIYDLPYAYSKDSIVMLILTIYVGILGLVGIGFLVNYILQAIAIYRLAKNRNIKGAWLAWMPVINSYTVGAISDYHDKSRGLNRAWRKTLLITKLLGPVMFLVTYLGFLAVVLFIGLGERMLRPSLLYGTESIGVLGIIVAAILFYLLIIVAALIMSVYQYGTFVCLYKIYDIVVPTKAVKYFIISLIVPFGVSICLMCARKSRLGIAQTEINQIEE